MVCAGGCLVRDWSAPLSRFRETRDRVSTQRRLVLADIAGSAFLVHQVLQPSNALASGVIGDSDFMKVISAGMGILDGLAVGVFIFAGGAWMFGDRTKAMQHLIGGASGYLIARHAVDIRNFLRGI